MDDRADNANVEVHFGSIKNKSDRIYDYKAINSGDTKAMFDSIDTGKFLQLHCRFYIKNDGKIKDVSVEGNMPYKIKQLTTYYLSRLDGLLPSPDHDYTDVYLYSVTRKKHDILGYDFYVSYFDRAQYH